MSQIARYIAADAINQIRAHGRRTWRRIPAAVDTKSHAMPSRGRSPSNWELSTARALSVVRYLTTEGVPPQRLAATGFGEFQPIDTGNGPASHARNRRIEMRLTDRRRPAPSLPACARRRPRGR
jgi:hypothetical protein